MDTKAEVYVSNIRILFSDLKKAINDYYDHGHTTGEVKYINAYLMAVIGAIAAYKDTVLKGHKESDEIKACKCANNMLKHDPEIISHIKPVGGFHFSASSQVVFPEIDVVWRRHDLEGKCSEQKKAYMELFSEQSVLETLGDVLNQLGIEVQS